MYGTTAYGGSSGNGNVFRLIRSGAGWSENVVYSFLGGVNGAAPQGGVVLDNSGNLYGGTTSGGSHGGGVAYELTPAGNGWTYTILANFRGGIDANLALDAAGNLYGTTYTEGAYDDGMVFKLSPSDGIWTESAVGSFNGPDGALPIGEVLVGANGTFYGNGNCRRKIWRGCGVGDHAVAECFGALGAASWISNRPISDWWCQFHHLARNPCREDWLSRRPLPTA